MNLRRIQEKEEVNHQNENYPAKTRVKDSDLPDGHSVRIPPGEVKRQREHAPYFTC